MSWLKAATIAAGIPKISIIAKLKQSMSAMEPARDYKTVHASDVTKPDFCPRRWAYYSMSGTTPPGMWIGTALRATFDLGHAMAKVLTEQWARDIAVGNWRCKTCGAQRTMSLQPKPGCLKGDCHWEYQEAEFVSQAYGISGSIDVLFDLGASLLAITELKTYAADEFDKMLTPLPEHRTRTRLYMKLVADSDSPYKNKINVHQARILYASRGYGRMNAEHGEVLPFREFVVERDDQALDVQLALNKGLQVKVYREQGLMPSGICGTPLEKTAKACKFCQECFSGKNPSNQPPLQ
jgi:hypothetical protein